jgi:hypothetical protein
MAEAKITDPATVEPNFQDPTARANPPAPVMVVAGEGVATLRVSLVLLPMGKWN